MDSRLQAHGATRPASSIPHETSQQGEILSLTEEELMTTTGGYTGLARYIICNARQYALTGVPI
jgi:hypothetical protein